MNRNIIGISALALLMIIVTVGGCDDRGTNVPDRPGLDGGAPWTTANHIFSPQLRFQFQNDLEMLPMWVFIPQVASPPPLGESRPVPLLILLAPQFEDQFYYSRHGLKTLLKELIANGTIQPMIVACVANNPAFGGYFYAGGKNFENLLQPTSGAYDYIIGDLGDSLGGALISYLRNSLHILPTRQKTGIGGVGMGAYGAFRAALINDSAFGSISVTDGPLDFDGGYGSDRGLIDLFDDALREQGLFNVNDSSFDSSSAWPLSNMFIGGAFAFSPDDTVIYHRIIKPVGQKPYPAIDSTLNIDSTRTKFSGYIGPGIPTHRFDFYLPFDSSGAVYPYIWDNLWMTEDLKSLLDSSTNKLDGVKIWIGTTPEAQYNFYQQTQSWISTLRSAPYNYPDSQLTVRNYQGLPGQPATQEQYLYDLMTEMLIFHSKSFGK